MNNANNIGRTWHKGPPPHIGWWNTLRGEVSDPPNPMTWRWWDGANWSYGAHAKTCAPSAMASWQKNEGVVWSDYYPEGARVPRVDPSLPGNRGIVTCINMSRDDTPHQQFWAGKAWAALDARQTRADAAAAGSTPTVQAMKERVKPAPAALNPAYVPGSRQRLSEAIRAADVDFQGAMKRNTITCPTARRAGDPIHHHGYLRAGSNGQAQAEVKDPLREYSSTELLQEVIRRLR
jgi:hypothetical protein